MSRVVCFKQLNNQEVVGVLNEDPLVLARYAYIPNAIVLDDALVFHVQVVQDENGNPKAQVSFNPFGITSKNQGPSRVVLSGALLAEVELDERYEAGYKQAVSPIALPPGGGGRIIT